MDTVTPAVSATLKSIPIDQLHPNPWNRTVFDPQALDELAASLKAEGVREPLKVRLIGPDQYQIASGHRRWLAAQKAGLKELPCMVEVLSDEQVAEDNITINIQRENIPPLELARMIKAYTVEFNKTQELAAEQFGKSRTWATELIGFLSLAHELEGYVGAPTLGWDQLRALKAATSEVRQEVIRELKAGGLKPTSIEKRCIQLRLPQTHKSNFTPQKSTVDPFADVWTKAGAGNMAGWEMNYADEVWTLKLYGPDERQRLFLKDIFLKLAEAIGDVETERKQQKDFEKGMNQAFAPSGALSTEVTEAMQKHQQTLPPDEAKRYQQALDQMKAAQAELSEDEAK